MTEAEHQRALEEQDEMSARGQHRALSLVDALVAATAEVGGLEVPHYDTDFELVADLSVRCTSGSSNEAPPTRTRTRQAGHPAGRHKNPVQRGCGGMSCHLRATTKSVRLEFYDRPNRSAVRRYSREGRPLPSRNAVHAQ